jgi:predicted metalloprotease with PDZ domain
MQPAIRYTIAMPQPHTHLYHVTLTIMNVVGTTLDIALPVWTPGSYLVREYARHVQEFAAFGGESAQPLEWHKVDKATWRVAAGDADVVHVRYKVYANELTVRTSHLDGSHGYFNPATVCMYAVGRTSEPCVVDVDVPDGWRVTTGLPELDKGRRTNDELSTPSSLVIRRSSFVAQDYDELADSPFECGTHRLLTFDVDGVPHEIALWGHGNEDEAQLVADTRRIVETTRAMFGGLPYRRYLFIVHLANGSGGLEHRNSVSMLVNRWTFQPRVAYERYLGLTAHEFFHVWNVKRIRPDTLGPFDYSRENYTRQLWTAEGITSYYTDLLLLRAGLIDAERYLELLAEKIVKLQSHPGRYIQSLEQSSFDAWIKLYRPDENSANTAISYYLKGELVALLLDLEIRMRTNSARSLDDIMRALFQRFEQDGRGFAEEGGFQAAVEAVITPNQPGAFDNFFRRYVAGTDELDYDHALHAAGLQLEWSHERANGHTPAWLGVQYRAESGRLKVVSVRADGPAAAAGIYAGDELLALDGFRIDEERLPARLDERRAGDTVTLSLFRRDELLHVAVTLAEAPMEQLEIVPVAQPTAAQTRLLHAWLGATAALQQATA